MTDRELMQQALEALEMLAWYENPATKVQVRKPRDGGPIVTMYPHKVATDAAAPLRERLARQKQEPVALEDVYETIIQWDEGGGKRSRRELARRIVALYTAPQREWVGLTEEEIRSLPQWFPSHETAAVMPLVRAIEAKLKEKNA